MTRYFCKDCGARQGSKRELNEHVCRKRVRNEIPEGQELPPVGVRNLTQPLQEGVRNLTLGGSGIGSGNEILTRELSNEDDTLSNGAGVRNDESRCPPLLDLSKERGTHTGQEWCAISDPEPIKSAHAREQEAIAYVSSRTEYLTAWERSFFIGVQFTNQTLSSKQKLTLFEIEAKIKSHEHGLEEWREADARAQHPLKKLQPDHPKADCKYCQAEAESAVQAKADFEEDMAELLVLGEEIKVRRAREALQASRTRPGHRPAGRTLLDSSKRRITPNPPRFAPKEEGPANA